jgi:hypothetical protein
MALWNPNDGRLRGRAGVAQRQRRLRAQPLCRHCDAKGVVRLATVPDHITPLGLGGADTEDNIQCLCDEHHALKTATENVSTRGAANHPDWLEPSAVPVTIVCGPPCAGKTTYISERARPYDLVIDIDAIAKSIEPTYTHWTGRLSKDLLDRSIRARNAMLGSLKRRSEGAAWFIVSAPTKAERDWWQRKLGGQVVLLNPGAEECKRRAVTRGTPNAMKGVDAWERAARQPWRPTSTGAAYSKEVGPDGIPTDPRHPFNQ